MKNQSDADAMQSPSSVLHLTQMLRRLRGQVYRLRSTGEDESRLHALRQQIGQLERRRNDLRGVALQARRANRAASRKREALNADS